MKRIAAAAIIGLCVLTRTALSRADTPPNIWELSKNPDAFQQWREHLRLAQSVEMLDELKEIGGRTNENHRAAALAVAQNALDESTAPKTPLLRYDEAAITMHRATILGSATEWARAIALLEPLTKDFAGTLLAQDIWLKLAEVYVRVERTADEVHAYDEVIARAVVPESMITPLLNQGEAYMRNGNIDEAVSQFREVYRLAGLSPTGNEVGVLAQWDLALALDRSGDESGAIAAAKTATQMDGHCIVVTKLLKRGPSTKCKVGDDLGKDDEGRDDEVAYIDLPKGLYPVAKDNPNVYFVPDYERSWYLALGREALARDTDSIREASDHWKLAETEMMTYVAVATLHGGDKWLDLARKRLDTIRKHRAEADKRAGVTPSSVTRLD